MFSSLILQPCAKVMSILFKVSYDYMKKAWCIHEMHDFKDNFVSFPNMLIFFMWLKYLLEFYFKNRSKLEGEKSQNWIICLFEFFLLYRCIFSIQIFKEQVVNKRIQERQNIGKISLFDNNIQYLVWPPAAVNSAVTRRRIDSTSPRKSSSPRFAHSSLSAA